MLEEVVVTDRVALVFTLDVTDFHTYFVGCDEWGFSVWAHNACVTLRRYRYAGATWQAKHWSLEIMTDNGKAIHIHQTNDGNPRAPRRNADVQAWMAWHPQAKVEKVDPGKAVPGETVEKEKTYQIDNALAILAKQLAGNMAGNQPSRYNLVTNSCFTVLVPVLTAAGFGPFTASTDEASMDTLLGKLNRLVD